MGPAKGVTTLWGLSALDAVMLAVLALSVVSGLFRGLVVEVMSLLGWLAAYAVATVYAPVVALHLSISGAAASHAAAFALTFLSTWVVWALLTRLLRLLVHATPLRAIDRLLGGAFGALRAAVLLLAVAGVVAMTPAARSAMWRQSQGAAWLKAVSDGLRPVLPDELGRYLRP